MKFARRFDLARLVPGADDWLYDWIVEDEGREPRSLKSKNLPSLRDFEGGQGDVGDWIEQHLVQRRDCPFCGRKLGFCEIDTTSIAEGQWMPGHAPSDSTPFEWYGGSDVGEELAPYGCGDATYQLWACSCGYWQSAYLDSNHWLEGSIATSKLATFAERLPAGITAEVALTVRNRTLKLESLSPRQAEQLVAEVFRANFEHVEVRHVGRPGDGGVDVLLVESSSCTWLIQVKHHVKPAHSESVSTLRHLLGTLVIEGQTRGVVVSTADHFSYFASKAASRAMHAGYEVELVDRAHLMQLVDRCMSDDAWVAPLRAGELFYCAVPEGMAVLEKHFSRHISTMLKRG